MKVDHLLGHSFATPSPYMISDGGSAIASGDVDARSGAGTRGDVSVSGAVGNVT